MYRRFGGSEGEDKTAQAKREFHEAVAEYVKGDKAFKKAAKPKQGLSPPSSSRCPSPAGFRTSPDAQPACTPQDLLEKEVQGDGAALDQAPADRRAKPADLVVPKLAEGCCCALLRPSMDCVIRHFQPRLR